jgi:hypothetical protein
MCWKLVWSWMACGEIRKPVTGDNAIIYTPQPLLRARGPGFLRSLTQGYVPRTGCGAQIPAEGTRILATLANRELRKSTKQAKKAHIPHATFSHISTSPHILIPHCRQLTYTHSHIPHPTSPACGCLPSPWTPPSHHILISKTFRSRSRRELVGDPLLPLASECRSPGSSAAPRAAAGTSSERNT